MGESQPMNTDDTDYDALFAATAEKALDKVNAAITVGGDPPWMLAVDEDGTAYVVRARLGDHVPLVAVPLPSTPFVSAADLAYAIASTFRSDAVSALAKDGL